MLESYFSKLITLLTSKEKKKLIVLLLMMILGSFMEVAGIGALPVFIAIVSKPQLLEKYPVIHNSLISFGIETSVQLLTYGAIALIITYVLKNI